MGGCRCVFRECPVGTIRNPRMHFFHFPVKDQARLLQWLKMAGQESMLRLPVSQQKNRVVCARHFRDDCFMNYRRDRLTAKAVPTLMRLSGGLAFDYSTVGKDQETPVLVTLVPTTKPHLIPPADFECPLELAMEIDSEVRIVSAPSSELLEELHTESNEEEEFVSIKGVAAAESDAASLIELLEPAPSPPPPVRRQQKRTRLENDKKVAPPSAKKPKILNLNALRNVKQSLPPVAVARKANTTKSSEMSNRNASIVVVDAENSNRLNYVYEIGDAVVEFDETALESDSSGYNNLQHTENSRKRNCWTSNATVYINGNANNFNCWANNSRVCCFLCECIFGVAAATTLATEEEEEPLYIGQTISKKSLENWHPTQPTENVISLENHHAQLALLESEQKQERDKHAADVTAMQERHRSLEAKFKNATAQLETTHHKLTESNAQNQNLRAQIAPMKLQNGQLESANAKLEIVHENFRKESKMLEAKVQALQKAQVVMLQKCEKLEAEAAQQQVATVSTSKEFAAPSTPASAPTPPPPTQINSAASLSKAQLFNGIKKYLSASMVALVRMEMFGNSEREWKPDERRASVDLLRLGEQVYRYFSDEWRFRLPALRYVRDWLNETAAVDDEEDL